MRTIIYLGGNGIQILQGDMKKNNLIIRKQYMEAMEEGGLINGVVTNEAILLRAIKNADEDAVDFSNTTVVVNSSLTANKNVAVPKLTAKELEELSKTEFEDAANAENLVIDYMGIHGPQGTNMFCAAMERDLIESYRELFEKAGIKLKGIDTALSAAIRYIEDTPDYEGQTFALNILDGNNLLYILFENGKYIFSSRSRIMAERETDGFTTEMAAKLSSLVQFNKSQKSEYILGRSYYAGLTNKEITGLQEYMEDMEVSAFRLPNTDNIRPGNKFDEEFVLSTAFYTAAAFFGPKQGFNLLSAYKALEHPNRAKGMMNKWAIPPLVMLVLMVVIFTGFTVVNYRTQKKLDEANAYIEASANVTDYAEAQKVQSELATINSQLSALKKSRSAIDSYPVINSDKLDQIAGMGSGIIISSVNYVSEAGKVEISATAPNEYEAANYVAQLRGTGLFGAVEYTGYSYNAGSTSTTTSGNQTTTNTTAATYSFTAACQLKGGVGNVTSGTTE